MSRLYNVVLKECPLDTPFAPKKSYDGAGLALGNLFGGLVGGLIGLEAQGYTNQTNYMIAEMNRDQQRETNELNAELVREANKQNYKQFQEQNAFTLDMWNKANAYNNPKAQVARLLAAGINPSTAFGSAANASAIGSSSAPSAQAAQMVAPRLDYQASPMDYSFVGNSISAATNAYYDNQLKNEQAKKVSADGQISAINAAFQSQRNTVEIMKLRAEIENLLSNKKLSDKQRDYYSSMIDQIDQGIALQKAQWNDLIVKEKKNNALTDASTQNQLADALVKRSQAHLNSIVAQYQPQLMASGIQLNEAQIQNVMQSVAVGIQEGRLKTAQAVSQEIQNQIDVPTMKKELQKGHMRGYNKIIRRLMNAAELVGESLMSGLKGSIKIK